MSGLITSMQYCFICAERAGHHFLQDMTIPYTDSSLQKKVCLDTAILPKALCSKVIEADLQDQEKQSGYVSTTQPQNISQEKVTKSIIIS